jgi:hypothetical protein
MNSMSALRGSPWRPTNASSCPVSSEGTVPCQGPSRASSSKRRSSSSTLQSGKNSTPPALVRMLTQRVRSRQSALVGQCRSANRADSFGKRKRTRASLGSARSGRRPRFTSKISNADRIQVSGCGGVVMCVERAVPFVARWVFSSGRHPRCPPNAPPTPSNSTAAPRPCACSLDGVGLARLGTRPGKLGHSPRRRAADQAVCWAFARITWLVDHLGAPASSCWPRPDCFTASQEDAWATDAAFMTCLR